MRQHLKYISGIKQTEMEKVFSDLLKEMEISFNKPGEEMEKIFLE